MTSLAFLKNVELLSDLDDNQIASIADAFHDLEYQHGDRLFADGDPASHIWVVKEGQIDLRFDLPGRATSEESTISSIYDSMVFGWSCLVPPNKYKLSAYCASRMAKVMRINKKALDKIFKKDLRTGYQFKLNLLKVVGRRFQQLQNSDLMAPIAKTRITVHMGICGIAAGAREVMNTLLEEKTKAGRRDIRIVSSGCIGKCTKEPIVTVETGEGTVVYKEIDPDKMRRIFSEHIIEGNVQTDYLLSKQA